MFGDSEDKNFNKYFEQDDNGQIYYTSIGLSTRLPIDNAEYEEIIDRVNLYEKTAKYLSVLALTASVGWIFLEILKNSFDTMDLIWIGFSIIFFAITIAWVAYYSIMPLNRKLWDYISINKDNPDIREDYEKIPKKLRGRNRFIIQLCANIIFAVIVYYIVSTALSLAK